MWAAPVARVMMCAIIIDSLYQADRAVTHWFAILWVIWSAITITAALIGHHFRIGQLQGMAAIDAVFGALTIIMLPGASVPTIAFLMCSAVLALGCGIGPSYIAIIIALPATAWVIHAVLELFSVPGRMAVNVGDVNDGGLVTAIQLGAVMASAALMHRKIRVDEFTYKCNSIAMLKPDRSFEFDLQDLVDNLAETFSPERAFCVISRATINGGYRHYGHNCDPTLIAPDFERFLALANALPEQASIFDTDNNRCLPLCDDRPREFSDSEQQFAQQLKRQKFAVAIVQRMHIGRASGVLVVAASKPIDACLLVDAIKVEKNVAELLQFLTRMAEAERQFIADAHDVARRDLHDGVLQSMAALRMKLLTIAKRPELEDQPARLEIRKATDILTLEQVRLRGLLEISESENNTINLVARLDICLRAISLQWEIDAKIEFDDAAIPVDRESALNIEHLVREAIANAARHAKTSALTVRLSLKHDALMISFNDRGQGGSDANDAKRSKPLQSASLQHRLRLVNGTAYVEGLGKGTLLAISIPMEQIEDA